MKLYDHIKKLLEEDKELRNSDKKLIWRIWTDEERITIDFVYGRQIILRSDFMEATSPETIRRTRQKVQADHPELQSSESVKRAKKAIEDTKGNFVYKEEFTGKLF